MESYKIAFEAVDRVSPVTDRMASRVAGDLTRLETEAAGAARGIDRIGDEAAQTERQVSGLDRELRDLGRQLRGQARATADATRRQRVATNETRENTSALRRNRIELSRLSNSMQQAAVRSAVMTTRMGPTYRGLNAMTGAVAGLTAGLGAFAAIEIANSIRELNELGDAANKKERAFRSLTSALGDYQDIMAGMRERTGGILTDQEIQEASTQILATQIATSREEMSRIVGLGTDLAAVLGREVDFVIENVMTAILNTSYRRLDQIGLSAAIARPRVAELQSDIGREEAFKIALLEQGEDLADAQREVISLNQTALDRMGVDLRNTIEDIGQGLNNMLVSIAEWMRAETPGQFQENVAEARAAGKVVHEDIRDFASIVDMMRGFRGTPLPENIGQVGDIPAIEAAWQAGPTVTGGLGAALGILPNDLSNTIWNQLVNDSEMSEEDWEKAFQDLRSIHAPLIAAYPELISIIGRSPRIPDAGAWFKWDSATINEPDLDPYIFLQGGISGDWNTPETDAVIHNARTMQAMMESIQAGVAAQNVWQEQQHNLPSLEEPRWVELPDKLTDFARMGVIGTRLEDEIAGDIKYYRNVMAGLRGLDVSHFDQNERTVWNDALAYIDSQVSGYDTQFGEALGEGVEIKQASLAQLASALSREQGQDAFSAFGVSLMEQGGVTPPRRWAEGAGASVIAEELEESARIVADMVTLAENPEHVEHVVQLVYDRLIDSVEVGDPGKARTRMQDINAEIKDGDLRDLLLDAYGEMMLPREALGGIASRARRMGVVSPGDYAAAQADFAEYEGQRDRYKGLETIKADPRQMEILEIIDSQVKGEMDLLEDAAEAFAARAEDAAAAGDRLAEKVEQAAIDAGKLAEAFRKDWGAFTGTTPGDQANLRTIYESFIGLLPPGQQQGALNKMGYWLNEKNMASDYWTGDFAQMLAVMAQGGGDIGPAFQFGRDTEAYARQMLESGMDPQAVAQFIKERQPFEVRNFPETVQRQTLPALTIDTAMTRDDLSYFTGLPEDQMGRLLMQWGEVIEGEDGEPPDTSAVRVMSLDEAKRLGISVPKTAVVLPGEYPAEHASYSVDNWMMRVNPMYAGMFGSLGTDWFRPSALGGSPTWVSDPGASTQVHIVEKGETISGIEAEYGLPRGTLRGHADKRGWVYEGQAVPIGAGEWVDADLNALAGLWQGMPVGVDPSTGEESSMLGTLATETDLIKNHWMDVNTELGKYTGAVEEYNEGDGFDTSDLQDALEFTTDTLENLKKIAKNWKVKITYEEVGKPSSFEAEPTQ